MKWTKLFTTFIIFLVVLFAGCKKDDYVEKLGVCFQVIATDPIDVANSVPYNKIVSATFNAKANPMTLDTNSFTLQHGTTFVEGYVSYIDSTATFTPTTALLPSTLYTATIKHSVKNTWGNGLQADYVWSFTTIPLVTYTLTLTAIHGSIVSYPNRNTFEDGTSVELMAIPGLGYVFDSWSGDVSGSVNPLDVTMRSNKHITANFTLLTAGLGAGPGPLDLRGAALYTVLSKTGISTTGVSSIEGNIGVSPNKAIGITGFGLIVDASGMFSKSNPSTLVSGKIYASDYAVPTPSNISNAVSDMETAFTTANGLTTTVITELGAGNISGMTLAPGLYKWGTGLLISANGVTLSGTANDTWVFQIGQGMTVADGAHIILAGGAQAKNIFWITASDAVIGSTVHFNGNILSQTLISINTGSTVTGRLLGQTAVTLNAATVVAP